ncbi:MAG: Veg family protein [Clostridia bacterium]|nr:Veg family protein [Clostridia bacterium]
MAVDNILEKIKGDLDSFVGKTVKLKANQGRKKILEAEGVLEQTYPKVFVVRINENPHTVKRVSYSYADVLTSTVEVSIDEMGAETRIGCMGS